MTIVLQLLLATLLITGMAVLRHYATNNVAQQRLRCDSASDKRLRASCSHGCGRQKEAPKTEQD